MLNSQSDTVLVKTFKLEPDGDIKMGGAIIRNIFSKTITLVCSAVP